MIHVIVILIVLTAVVEPSFSSNAWIHDIADKDKFLFCMEYRGKETDHFASELHK